MNQWVIDMNHEGWKLHDLYWLGACIFILHFVWLCPSTLKRKNVIWTLLLMTAFWPVTYTLSILQIYRLRRLKQ